MKLRMLFVAVVAIAALSGGCGRKTAPSPADEAAISAADLASVREVTQISAKHALARLQTELLRQGKPLAKLWKVSPANTAIYQEYRNNESTSLSWVVGGWILDFEDESGANYEAEVNCWGEINLSPSQIAGKGCLPIKPEEVVVDNRDANRLVLEKGGEATQDRYGGRLTAMQVSGRGIRPVWDGGGWIVPNSSIGREMHLGVDAQTGELYKIADTSIEPVFSVASGPQQWDGGFNAKSADATEARSQKKSCWPYCYRDSATGRFVYNHKFLRDELKKLEAKKERKADSWIGTATIKVALGDYCGAISDLDKALELDRANETARTCRGFVYLMIRDLEAASADLQDQQTGLGLSLDAGSIFQLLRGQGGKYIDAVRSFQTKAVGAIPLEFQVGDEPFQQPSRQPKQVAAETK